MGNKPAVIVLNTDLMRMSIYSHRGRMKSINRPPWALSLIINAQDVLIWPCYPTFQNVIYLT